MIMRISRLMSNPHGCEWGMKCVTEHHRKGIIVILRCSLRKAQVVTRPRILLATTGIDERNENDTLPLHGQSCEHSIHLLSTLLKCYHLLLPLFSYGNRICDAHLREARVLVVVMIFAHTRRTNSTRDQISSSSFANKKDDFSIKTGFNLSDSQSRFSSSC